MKTQTNEKQIKSALNIIAQTRLSSSDSWLIECEVGRLERCLEFFYREEDHDFHLFEFYSHFIQKNFKELTFGTLFSGDYTEDVLDNIPPDITYYFKNKALKENGGALNNYAKNYGTEYCEFNIATIDNQRYNKMVGYDYE